MLGSYLEAGALGLVHIPGLQVCTPALDQILMVVVVLGWHLWQFVMVRMVHVYNLQSTYISNLYASL